VWQCISVRLNRTCCAHVFKTAGNATSGEAVIDVFKEGNAEARRQPIFEVMLPARGSIELEDVSEDDANFVNKTILVQDVRDVEDQQVITTQIVVEQLSDEPQSRRNQYEGYEEEEEPSDERQPPQLNGEGSPLELKSSAEDEERVEIQLQRRDGDESPPETSSYQQDDDSEEKRISTRNEQDETIKGLREERCDDDNRDGDCLSERTDDVEHSQDVNTREEHDIERVFETSQHVVVNTSFERKTSAQSFGVTADNEDEYTADQRQYNTVVVSRTVRYVETKSSTSLITVDQVLLIITPCTFNALSRWHYSLLCVQSRIKVVLAAPG
jgi:hypothetical protein